ncbi:hypothetical protein MAPG_11424 [Magnaporthiopsis poae ATCC 64411]|uniref:DUF7924 domain-containing protein n=1 Tax=Magnaporthiopsis poae (strain ATCC 64411 / 73-15) TaxID=644358 RepID=A0A0C4EF85_MAGP6|nr:hypothetical protein MAPG_11424 [Magnaporthiopsis poae ATCC 64411]
MNIKASRPSDASKALCESLLELPQPVPGDTIFRDDTFELACLKLHGKNQARIIQDIGRLIVPSAEGFATLGAAHLDILVESVNEGWNNSVPLSSPRPRPDYAVGFGIDAFTADQLAKLSPLVGEVFAGDKSLFMATFYMYFPFLTCEVKSGRATLDVADRQNAHSMTLAVRAVVELFRAVNREAEIDRQILAFSISHSDTSVKIYSHYPVMEGKETKYYRHPIQDIGIMMSGGKDRWTPYRFTKNVYDVWMPTHFRNICSAIDQLPRMDAAAHELGAGSVSELAEDDAQLASSPEQQRSTPETSSGEPGNAKRRKE